MQTESASVQEPAAEAQPDSIPQPEMADVSSVMFPPESILAQLWAIYSDEPLPETPCSTQVQSGLACFAGEAWTWDELASVDRPLALEAITPERFSAEVLLLGMVGPTAWVLTEEGVAQISLAVLAPYWTGRYRFLWHVPEGFENSLMLGQESDVVATVAQLFARLDGQAEPLAGRRFNRALQQRVRLFQQDQLLVDDGMVGLQTLFKLNEQLGIDVTAAQARQWLQDATSEGPEQ